MPGLFFQASFVNLDFTIEMAPAPALQLRALRFQFALPLSETPYPPALEGWLSGQTVPPLQVSETLRTSVRAMLRQGGFKASGRSKPASEFLANQNPLPRINPAVDAGNVVSLYSGLPVSVIDLDLTTPPWRVQIVPDKVSYVFNPSGQELDLKGLICLWDQLGPCASPVKDSQRSKTRPQTQNVLCLIWGCADQEAQGMAAERFFREVLGTFQPRGTLQSVDLKTQS